MVRVLPHEMGGMMGHSKLTRRGLLLGAALAAGGVGYWAYSRRNLFDGRELTPEQAFDMAQAGDVILIDIRRPQEWAYTGSAAGAHRLDMRRPDFQAALNALVNNDRAHPIALICAAGVRSDHLSARLAAAGYSNVMDVPEGMTGSAAGPGWVRRGLPVVK